MNENEVKKPSKALLKLYAVTEAAIKVMEDSLAEEEQNQDQAKKQEAHSQDQ